MDRKPANIASYFIDEIRSAGSYLVPMRLFLGSVWLRAGFEKVVSDTWFSGHDITAYLTTQMVSGTIHIPVYQQLIESVFLPNAQTMSWLVVIGQLMTGIGILFGALTNAALLGGLFNLF